MCYRHSDKQLGQTMKAILKALKHKYVYVDIFDYINIDLSKPQGAIVTNLNGRQAEYMEQLKDGDVIDVYWKN